jgi:hypothetical protein
MMDNANNDTQKLPFPERIKAESNGYGALSKEFVDRQKSKELGYAVQVARRLGRPITEKEVRTWNI